MKRAWILLACAGALFMAACGGDSKLPNPTGKGSVRALNAIPGSPPVTFLIEERGLAEVAYKDSSSRQSYDDFVYDFHFEVFFPGEIGRQRVATINHTVEKDRSHIFVLTGDINAPTITTWNGDIRQWEGTETTFETRFAHTMQSRGPVDVHFNPTGEAPAAGQQAATLQFGEISDAALFEQGDYVITITAANDLNTVYFTSGVEAFASITSHVITALDGDANDTAPVSVSSLTSTAGTRRIVDVNYPPTLRVVQGSLALPATDIYDDEALTSLFVQNLAFGDATADLPVSGEERTYFFTPASSTAAVLFQRDLASRGPGTHTHMMVVGEADNYSATVYFPDRAPFSTAARLRLFNASSNAGSIDVYVVDRDEPIGDDTRPRSFQIPTGFLTPILQFTEGNYDVYVTPAGDKTALTEAFQIDASLGDVVELIALDTQDPNVVVINELPIP